MSMRNYFYNIDFNLEDFQESWMEITVSFSNLAKTGWELSKGSEGEVPKKWKRRWFNRNTAK